MSNPSGTDERAGRPAAGPPARQTRQQREAAALRANLLKRKDRQRQRDRPPDGPKQQQDG